MVASPRSTDSNTATVSALPRSPQAQFARRVLLHLTSVVVLLTLAGCSAISSAYFCTIPRDPKACDYGDRCYISDEMFIKADQYYSRYGTLDMVHRHLYEYDQLRECEINEALYRLRKVHGLP